MYRSHYSTWRWYLYFHSLRYSAHIFQGTPVQLYLHQHRRPTCSGLCSSHRQLSWVHAGRCHSARAKEQHYRGRKRTGCGVPPSIQMALSVHAGATVALGHMMQGSALLFLEASSKALTVSSSRGWFHKPILPAFSTANVILTSF